MRRWVSAYRIMGEEAHIFKVIQKRYSGADNRGGNKGVSKFSIKNKMDIIDRCGGSKGMCEVAYECGISPDTIGKWKRELNYPCVVRREKEYKIPRRKLNERKERYARDKNGGSEIEIVI